MINKYTRSFKLSPINLDLDLDIKSLSVELKDDLKQSSGHGFVVCFSTVSRA